MDKEKAMDLTQKKYSSNSAGFQLKTPAQKMRKSVTRRSDSR